MPYGNIVEAFLLTTKMAAADVSQVPLLKLVVGPSKCIQRDCVLRLLITALGKLNRDVPGQYTFPNWPGGVRLCFYYKAWPFCGPSWASSYKHHTHGVGFNGHWRLRPGGTH